MRLLNKGQTGKSRAGLVFALLIVAALASTGPAHAAGAGGAPRVWRAADAGDLARDAIGSLPYEEARVYFVAEDGAVLRVAAVTQRLRHGVYYIPWELAFGDLSPAGTRRIYMVHNHPGGDPALSEADIRLGSFWAARAADEGLELDLLAVTPAGEQTSLRESGQLRPVPGGVAAALGYAGYVLAPGVQMARARLWEAARALIR